MEHYTTWIPHTIRTLRQNAGLSQEELCQRIGAKSSGTISHFETGARIPSIDMLDKIFTACGVTLKIGFDANTPILENAWVYVKRDDLRNIVALMKKIDVDVTR